MKAIHLLTGGTLAFASACSDRPEAVPPVDASSPDDARTLRDLAERMVDAEQVRDDANLGSGHGDGVHPRWVLRDSGGAAVEVQAIPVVPIETPQTLELPPRTSAPGCFAVSMRGNERWSGMYSLATGTMGCVPELESSLFIDEACDEPITIGSAAAPQIVRFQGELVYGRDRVAIGTPLFSLSAGDCISTGTVAESPAWYSFEEVPAQYVNAFADGAPYTIAFEY